VIAPSGCRPSATSDSEIVATIEWFECFFGVIRMGEPQPRSLSLALSGSMQQSQLYRLLEAAPAIDTTWERPGFLLGVSSGLMEAPWPCSLPTMRRVASVFDDWPMSPVLLSRVA